MIVPGNLTMCSDLQSVFALAPQHVRDRALLTKRRMMAQEMLRQDQDLSHTIQDLDAALTADMESLADGTITLQLYLISRRPDASLQTPCG